MNAEGHVTIAGADSRAGHGLGAPLRCAIYFIALCLAAAALYFAQTFFIPVALSLLLALILSPIVRAARRRGVPHVVSAVALVSMVAVAMVAGALLISAPAAQWISRTPELGARLEQRLNGIREPVEAVNRASEQVEQATDSRGPAAEVVVKGPSLFSRAAENAMVFLASFVLTLLLTVFILSSSDIFYSKLVRLAPTLSAKKHALSLVHGIENEVSRYLLTVTTINCALGTVIGLAMWAVGLPQPYLWGVAAALLNFMPYVGMILGVAMVSAVALVTFDTVAYAMLAPLSYLACTSIEGGIITPVILGRRLSINTVAIMLAISFWGWLWGVVGILIAVPLLVITKVVCDHIAPFAPFAEFLSGDRELRAASLQVAEKERRPADV